MFGWFMEAELNVGQFIPTTQFRGHPQAPMTSLVIQPRPNNSTLVIYGKIDKEDFDVC